ncbi:uncharacterized protein BJ171DRAFT_240376 [Polychytrium aggregatum]|uniref:uncharacterized protein n=1 Tax=Polychytrium aggregatum TaxID=110093 RepID=UPI0022FDCB9E|nr:uncharacterized protein BJ171DRAFT_240376 [Polychytrium aggregatum]KAI9197126.1 hypothetical protein BJ171DRAFT_240376 [Polychytrium aggregatum]
MESLIHTATDSQTDPSSSEHVLVQIDEPSSAFGLPSGFKDVSRLSAVRKPWTDDDDIDCTSSSISLPNMDLDDLVQSSPTESAVRPAVAAVAAVAAAAPVGPATDAVLVNTLGPSEPSQSSFTEGTKARFFRTLEAELGSSIDYRALNQCPDTAEDTESPGEVSSGRPPLPDHPTDDPTDHITDHPTDHPADHPTEHPADHPAGDPADKDSPPSPLRTDLPTLSEPPTHAESTDLIQFSNNPPPFAPGLPPVLSASSLLDEIHDLPQSHVSAPILDGSLPLGPSVPTQPEADISRSPSPFQHESRSHVEDDGYSYQFESESSEHHGRARSPESLSTPSSHIRNTNPESPYPLQAQPGSVSISPSPPPSPSPPSPSPPSPSPPSPSRVPRPASPLSNGVLPLSPTREECPSPDLLSPLASPAVATRHPVPKAESSQLPSDPSLAEVDLQNASNAQHLGAELNPQPISDRDLESDVHIEAQLSRDGLHPEPESRLEQTQLQSKPHREASRGETVSRVRLVLPSPAKEQDGKQPTLPSNDGAPSQIAVRPAGTLGADPKRPVAQARPKLPSSGLAAPPSSATGKPAPRPSVSPAKASTSQVLSKPPARQNSKSSLKKAILQDTNLKRRPSTQELKPAISDHPAAPHHRSSSSQDPPTPLLPVRPDSIQPATSLESAQLASEIECLTRLIHDKDEAIRKLTATIVEKDSAIQSLKDEVDFLEKLREERDLFQAGRVRVPDAIEGVPDSELAALRRQFEEQEALIAGFQRENEKLDEQVRRLKKKAKETEHQFFLKHEATEREIAHLRQQLHGRENDADFGAAKLRVRLEELEHELQHTRRDAEDQREAMKGELVKVRAQLAEANSKLRELTEASPEELDRLRGQLKESKERYEAYIVQLEGKLEAFSQSGRLPESHLAGGPELQPWLPSPALLESIDDFVAMVETLGLTTQAQRTKIPAASHSSRRTDGKRPGQQQPDRLEQKLAQIKSLVQTARASTSASTSGGDSAFGLARPAMDQPDYIRRLRERIKQLELDAETTLNEHREVCRQHENKLSRQQVEYEEQLAELKSKNDQLYRSLLEAAEKTSSETIGLANDRISQLEQQLSTLLNEYSQQLKEANNVKTLGSELEQTQKLLSLSEAKVETLTERMIQQQSKLLEYERLMSEYEETLTKVQKTKNSVEAELLQNALEKDRLVSSYEAKIVQMQQMWHDKVFAVEETKWVEEVGKLRTELEQLRMTNLNLKNKYVPFLPTPHPLLHGSTPTALPGQRGLQISETARKAVQENTLAILKQTQQETSQISSAHYHQAVELAREETRRALQSAHQLEVRELKRARDDAEKQLQVLRDKHGELQEQCRRLEASLEEAKLGSDSALRRQSQQLQQQLRVARQNWTPDMHAFARLEEQIRTLEEQYSERESDIQKRIQVHAQELARKEVERVRAMYEPLLKRKNQEIEGFRRELEELMQGFALLKRKGGASSRS